MPTKEKKGWKDAKAKDRELEGLEGHEISEEVDNIGQEIVGLRRRTTKKNKSDGQKCQDSLTGRKSFLDTVTEEKKRTLDVLKIEDGRFRSTGKEIGQIGNQMESTVDEDAESLEDILRREDKPSEPQ